MTSHTIIKFMLLIFVLQQNILGQEKDFSTKNNKVTELPESQYQSELNFQKTNKSLLVDLVAQRASLLKKMNQKKDYFKEQSYRIVQYGNYTYAIENPYYGKLYKQQQKIIDEYETKTLFQIQACLDQGESLHTKDNKGKTALDYAESYEMYHLLRSHGVGFQLNPFVSFHPLTTSVITAALAALVYLISQKIMYDINTYTQINNNLNNSDNKPYETNNLKSCDDQGQTPLMNYLIQQEGRLLELRTQIINLEDQEFSNTLYYDTIIQYQIVRDTTQRNIREMIFQGASLDVVNIFGKNLLDYCRTEEIYFLLKDAGAPYSYTTWIYFEGRRYLTISSLSLLSIVALHKILEAEQS